jgi:hypothetical protein
MRMPRFTLTTHFLLLFLFVVLVTGVMMIPVLVAGFPYMLPSAVPSAQHFAKTGLIPMDDFAIVVLVFWLLHPLIGWENMVGWAAVSVGFFSVSLLPLWWAIRRLINARVAWLSVVILSALPIIWQNSLEIGAYSFSYFFLFLGFALFLTLHERHRLAATALTGLCMGAVIVCSPAFIALLPWFIGAYLWHMRKNFLQATIALGVFLLCFGAGLVMPLLPNALQEGLPVTERMAMLTPFMRSSKPGIGHLYPDEYTYQFLRPEFDERARQRLEGASFIERQDNENFRIIFGASEYGFVDRIGNGLWLFLNVFPAFFFEEMLGGVFLWLFIIPGIVALWRTNRLLLINLVGLWLSMEFQLRFILHFARAHIDDIVWGIALLAGLGIATLVPPVQRLYPRMKPSVIASIIVVVVALQLLQADRQYMAKKYSRSNVPMIYAAAAALRSVPSDAVVAHPRKQDLLYSSPQTPVSLHPDTIDYLEETGRLRDPFSHYGIRYIIGYDEERTRMIQAAVPGIMVVSLPESPPGVALTPLTRYLLNLTR